MFKTEKRDNVNLYKLVLLDVRDYIIRGFVKIPAVELPKQIQDYFLEKKLQKQWEHDTNQLGIYKNKNGERAFAKMLPYRLKNTAYFKLLNEIQLYKIMNTFTSINAFRAPKFITESETNNMKLLLLEYIQGKRGDRLNPKKKFDLYIKKLAYMNFLEKKLTEKEKMKFSKRTPLQYMMLYPFLLAVALIRHPETASALRKGFIVFVKNFYLLFSYQNKLVLSHRDFHFKNVIVGKKENVILDFESCCFTIFLYDTVLTLQHEWNDKLFTGKLIQELEKKYKTDNQFAKYFSLLIVLAGTHSLTANNFSKEEINKIHNFLQFGITYKTEKKVHYFFILRRLLFVGLYYFTRIYPSNVISVLCYHSISDNQDRYSVSKDTFEKSIKKISQQSTFIPFNEALSAYFSSKSSVVITFDDGYKDLLEIIPIIKKYNIQPIAFVLSHPEKANRKELANKNTLLTANEIKQLYRAGFTIGSHGATHADLTTLSKSKLEFEIVESKKTLEKKLSVPIQYFAYPKGKYNTRVVQAVKKAGYDAAFSIEPGCISPQNNQWILPRTIIDKTHQVSEFPAVYYPSTFWIRNLTNKLRLWERFLAV